jgi:hypothetical protein
MRKGRADKNQRDRFRSDMITSPNYFTLFDIHGVDCQ